MFDKSRACITLPCDQGVCFRLQSLNRFHVVQHFCNSQPILYSGDSKSQGLVMAQKSAAFVTFHSSLTGSDQYYNQN